MDTWSDPAHNQGSFIAGLYSYLPVQKIICSSLGVMWGTSNWNQPGQQQPNQWPMPMQSDGEINTEFVP